MLRLQCLHSSGFSILSLQQMLKLLDFRSISTKRQSSASAIPEQWRQGFTHTAAVPAGAPASITAFSWAKKQAPDVSLAHLSKLFRQRQVRVLQQGQVKRVSRTRQLEPGDILLLPTQQQQHAWSPGSGSSSKKDAYAAFEEEDTADWDVAVFCQRQQQQLHRAQQQQQKSQSGLLPWQDYVSVDLKDQRLQQPPPQQQQQEKLLKEQQEVEQLVEQELAELELRLQQQEHEQQKLHSRRRKQQQQQQQQQQPELTVQLIRKMLLASSRDIAVLYKPPGLSLHVATGSSKTSTTLHPNLAEALNIKTPERPQLVCGLDAAASGAVVISRHAAAYEWLSAWVAGEPAAVAAAAAALAGLDSDDVMAAATGQKRKGLGHRGLALNPRARQQQQKLQKLANLAAVGSSSGNSATAAAGFTAKELKGLQQLREGVGGLRIRRIFWAVVQGDLAVRRSGTLSNRMLRGDEALPTLTRYKVLASRDGLSLLELQPLTNRPNQIRMQCGKVLRAPIIGDYKYGYRPWSNSPAAQPWLSRYIAEAEATSSSSRQRQQHSNRSRIMSQDLQVDEPSDDLDVDLANHSSHDEDLPEDFAGGVPAGWEVSSDRASAAAAAPAAAAEPLLLHCREVVLLRPRKAPVRVVAPLPRNMKQLLHAMEWR